MVDGLGAFTSTPAANIFAAISLEFPASSSMPINNPAPRTYVTPGISFSITEIAANPAAVVTGLPPKVEP